MPIPRSARSWPASCPSCAASTPRTWLIQLSRDSDPGVRLTAITLMATSGDPLLLEQVARIAGEDPDQRIHDQVTRIEQQRNDAGQRGMAAPAPASP